MEVPDTTENQKERFLFKGDASEYFGIWIVNNTLTWLTLGIYSPWAKVRTLQYFQGNTELAGGRFQFTANPLTILRSRLIAVALMVLYIVVNNVDSTAANVALVAMIAAFFLFAPVLTILVMSFRLRYSEWRGISFKFNKDYAGAYRVYLLPIFFSAVTVLCLLLPFNSIEVEEALGIDRHLSHASDEGRLEDDLTDELDVDHDSKYNALKHGPDHEDYQDEKIGDEDWDISDDEYASEHDSAAEDGEDEEDYINPYLFIPSGAFLLLFLCLLPYFDFINTRFLSRNVRLGTARFRFTASAKDYYRFYGVWLITAIVVAGLWAVQITTDIMEDFGLFSVLVILTIAYFPGSVAYLKSRRYNVLLSNTVIAEKHKLCATTPFLGMLFIMLTNSLAVFFTFGLMKPWARIRTVRFLLKHSSLEVNGSLDDFIAEQKAESSAIGEEIADVFDLDLIG